MCSGSEPVTLASSLSYEFRMHWYKALPKYLPGEGKPGWTGGVSYSYITWGRARAGWSSFELHQAIAVAEKAARYDPVRGEPTDIP